MIVLSGPTGNVGAEVARLFAQHRDPATFRVAAHHPDRVRAELGGAVAVVGFDFDDPSTWDAAFHGIRALFLVFPLPTPRAVRTRMIPVIDAAVAAGCRHIVYLSVPGADVAKVVPHYRVERHIENSGASWTFLRSAYFMQNLHRTISSHGVDIAEHDEVFIPAGRGATSFVDARDVAEVARLALLDPDGHSRRGYVLTGAAALSMQQVAQTLTEVLGRPIHYPRPSMARFWWRLLRRRVPLDSVVFMTIVYSLTRAGRNAPLTGDLERLLGRPPRGLRDWAGYAAWRWRERAWT